MCLMYEYIATVEPLWDGYNWENNICSIRYKIRGALYSGYFLIS